MQKYSRKQDSTMLRTKSTFRFLVIWFTFVAVPATALSLQPAASLEESALDGIWVQLEKHLNHELNII